MTGATRWPSLARDLAIMTAPDSPLRDLGAVLQSYNLTEDEFKGTLEIPEFRSMFAAELERVKAQGNRAGIQYRMTTLSQALSEKLFRDAVGNGMKAAESIRFLELLMKSAGLMEPPKETVQVNTQVNVQLPLPLGLDNNKLKHLEPVHV